MNTYDTEKWALDFALDGDLGAAETTVSHLSQTELDRFNDALDKLAAMVDQETIQRATYPRVRLQP